MIADLGTFRFVFYLFGAIPAQRSASCRFTMRRSRAFSHSSMPRSLFRLAIGALQFARMILLPPHTEKT